MIKTLPHLSRKNISTKVNHWLRSISDNVFPNDYLDLDKLISYLKRQHNLDYVETSLGGHSDHKILGLMDAQNNRIYIDSILDNHQEIKRFTQAHEIAHWVLHRHVDLNDYQLADTPHTLNQARQLSTTYDWVEWQANTFAAYLLIPEKRFLTQLNNIITLLNIEKNIHLFNTTDWYKIHHSMAHCFQVSKTVAAIYIQQYIKTIKI